VRTEEGRRIREAFVAPEGRKLVSLDYSQIELRILAHIAEIPQLKQAFADGLDIHALTASEMFDVPLDQMTPDIRRRAKAINFGVIYGISGFGLARNLRIPRAEAQGFIDRYFERFPGIRDYMDETKAFAKDRAMSRPSSAAASTRPRSTPRARPQASPSAPRSTRPFRAPPPTSSAAP
jgi:DNA polymerase I